MVKNVLDPPSLSLVIQVVKEVIRRQVVASSQGLSREGAINRILSKSQRRCLAVVDHDFTIRCRWKQK